MLRLLFALAVPAMAASPAVFAQPLARSAWITGGPTEHDAVAARATGVGARADIRVLPFVVVDAGVLYAPLGAVSRRAYALLLPDVQIQAELPLGPVRPYLGAGIGAHVALESTALCSSIGEESSETVCRADDRFDAALAVSLGDRVDLGQRLRVRLDGRLLKAETFGSGGNVLGLMAGVGYGF